MAPLPPLARPRLAGLWPAAAGRLGHGRLGHGRLGHPAPRWLVAFVVTFGLGALWAVGSPLFSGPDEPAHVLRSVSLVHGSLVGRPQGGPASPVTQVTVPAWLAGVNSAPDCFKGRPDVPASCEPMLTGASGSVREVTYAGRYPPLYYAVVGWPSLFAGGRLALWLMRLCSAGASAAFLAGAISCAWRSERARGLLVGMALVVTPQVFFLAGVINPSGLEISAAICVWSSALVAFERDARAGRWVLAWLAAAGAVMANAVGLSPFLVLVIGLAVAAYAGRHRVMALLGDRVTRTAVLVIVGFGVLAVVWVLAAGALRVRPSGTRLPAGAGPWLAAGLTLENFGPETLQMVGVFGWVDTYLPPVCYALWLGLAAGFIGSGVASVPRRSRAALGGFAVAAIAVPAALLLARSATLGIFGQARDWMPLWVGLPLLVGHAVGPSLTEGATAWWRGLRALVIVTVAVMEPVAWAWALRRYRTGSGHLALSSPAAWSPPLPAPALLAGIVACSVALAWCYARAAVGEKSQR